MSLFYISPLGWVLRKAVTLLSDLFVRSPLEEDFGEYSEDDIAIPQSSFAATLNLAEAPEPMLKLVQQIDGFTVENVKRIGYRMRETRPHRTATLQFQVKDSGVPVELQVRLEKRSHGLVAFDFRSSEAVISVVRDALEAKERTPGEADIAD